MTIDKTDDQNQNSLVFGNATTIKGDVVGGNKFDIRFYALASLAEDGRIDWLNGHAERSEPYKFLSYYQTTDADIFFGREAVSESLASKISTHKLVLINGQSGSGKTSLINAGIIPNLIKKGYFTMVFRDYGYPTDVIKKGLTSLENLNLDLSNCHSLLECLQATRQQIQRPIVIFFDQFERFFLNLTSSEERQQFIQEFAECLRNMNALEMNFFIAIRQDFYGNLGEFWRESEFNTESYPHYLETLGEKEAISAIEKPITKIPDKIGYENGFVEQILLPDLIQSSETDNNQQINPVHLQIVCNSLFEEVKQNNASAIKAGKIISIGQDLYDKLNKVSGILQGYITKILNDKSKFTFDERTIAKSVLQQMVTSHGTRIFCSFENLTKKLEYSSNHLKSIIKKLDDSRLLETRNENNHTEYSITHEYLAEQINQWNNSKESEIKRAQEMWGRYFDNWSSSGRTITIPRKEYKYINKFKSHFQINEEGKLLLKSSARKYWASEALSFIGISILVGLTVVSVNGYRNATINQIRASIQASEANFNANKELEGFVEAIRAAKTLDKNKLLKSIPPNKDEYLDIKVKKALYNGHEKSYERNRLEGHNGSVNNAQFSLDGQLIVTASDDGTAKLWRSNGELDVTLEDHNGSVNNAQFSLDGKLIVTASDDRTAKVWRSNGELVATLGSPRYWVDIGKIPLSHLFSVNNAQFSPDGKYIVTASSDRTAIFWTRGGEFIATLEGHSFSVNNAQFSPDGKYIVTASSDRTAKVWRINGELLTYLTGHQSAINDAQFSPDGQLIVTASYDGTAKLWRSNGELVVTLPSHQRKVNNARFSPDGQYIITVSSDIHPSYDGTVKLWRINGELVVALEACEENVNNKQFSPNGEYVVSTSDDGTTKVLMSNGELVATLEACEKNVNNKQFSPNGKYIVSLAGNTVKVLMSNGELVAILKGHEKEITDIQFSPDGQLIATASNDDNAKIWTIKGELITTLEGHLSWSDFRIPPQGYSGGVNNVRFSPDGKFIVQITLRKAQVKLLNFDFNYMLEQGCQEIRGYLKHNPNVESADRTLCDGIAAVEEKTELAK